MADWIESVVLCVAAVGAMLVLDRLATRAERRKSPEQRKAEERWQWKHGRW